MYGLAAITISATAISRRRKFVTASFLIGPLDQLVKIKLATIGKTRRFNRSKAEINCSNSSAITFVRASCDRQKYRFPFWARGENKYGKRSPNGSPQNLNLGHIEPEVCFVLQQFVFKRIVFRWKDLPCLQYRITPLLPSPSQRLVLPYSPHPPSTLHLLLSPFLRVDQRSSRYKSACVV
jgi:hypothetical protein